MGVKSCMPAAGQAGDANLEKCAALESVQHKDPPEPSKAKGLNAFMAAKLANAIGKGSTFDFIAWQISCKQLLACITAVLLLFSFAFACGYTNSSPQCTCWFVWPGVVV